MNDKGFMEGDLGRQGDKGKDKRGIVPSALVSLSVEASSFINIQGLHVRATFNMLS